MPFSWWCLAESTALLGERGRASGAHSSWDSTKLWHQQRAGPTQLSGHQRPLPGPPSGKRQVRCQTSVLEPPVYWGLEGGGHSREGAGRRQDTPDGPRLLGCCQPLRLTQLQRAAWPEVRPAAAGEDRATSPRHPARNVSEGPSSPVVPSSWPVWQHHPHPHSPRPLLLNPKTPLEKSRKPARGPQGC